MNEQENEIVVYQPDGSIHLDVRLGGDSVWLTQEQMARLFGTGRPAITKHLSNIYKSGELDKDGTCSILEHMPPGGRRSYRTVHYNLDAILTVGYRVNSRNAALFRRWATQVLKAYLLRGDAFNQRLAQLEDRLDRRLAAHGERIGALEGKVDFFVRTAMPPVQGVFFDGQMFDATALAIRLLRTARSHILLIDPWVDVATLELVAKKAPDVAVELVTSARGNRLSPDEIAKFNAQYGNLSVSESYFFHDRFLAIDGRNLYLFGASLKDLGRKCCAFARLDPAFIPFLRRAVTSEK